MKTKPFLLVLLLAMTCSLSKGQTLFDLLEEPETGTIYASGTFQTTRIVSAQSVENPADGDLIFVVGHQFGTINLGAYHFFGLDQSTIRLGLEYGINDRLAASIGRSSFGKTYDTFAKYKLLRQSTGEQEMPVSLSLFGGVYLSTLRVIENVEFSSRISMVYQLLLARKFSHNFSLQLTPSLVQRNLPFIDNPIDLFAMGFGGRLRLTNWISINAEYFYVFNHPDGLPFYNPLSVGFDIETGGHVFQLHFSNSQLMFERGFIAETRGNWLDGDIHFGFNITRVFSLGRRKI
jgi:hypothetical protein